MNLDNAVAAHAQWKTKFRAAITNKDSMDAATIGKDNCCELGKWLYGDGKVQHGSKSEFVELVAKHKSFHAEAGKVATLINAKKFTEAESAISATTPFGQASSDTGLAINRLKKVA